MGGGDRLSVKRYISLILRGNGIEVYYDRPSEDWLWRDGFVKMDTLEVDVNDLMTQRSNEGWQVGRKKEKSGIYISKHTI